MALPFCLPGMAGEPGLLKETGVALTKGKTIRIARASLVTVWSEGSDRKRAAHSGSEPDSALRMGVSVQNSVKPGSWSDPQRD